MRKNKPPLLASRKHCMGCMACVDSCRFGALKGALHKDGHLYPVCDIRQCTGCGRCSKTCPVINGYDHGAAECHSVPYAAWANDDDLRMRSSSGGVFAAVATKILQEGGYVAGAVMDEFDVRHRLIDRIEDLSLLQGSKYQQGDLTGIYREVEQLLKMGRRVLFSGTGCQVGALHSYLGKRNYTGQLFTADLICTGFPSILPLRCFLKNEPHQIKALTYRDKLAGWYSNEQKRITSQNISVLTETDQWIKYPSDIVYKAFSSHLLNRSSCLDCRFAKAHRKSDLTLADFWGDKDYPEEHYKGLSVVVTHSPAGEKLLKESDVTFHSIAWRKFLPFNFRMANGRFRFLNFHPARLWAPYQFAHCSYKTLKHLYNAVSPTPLWFPYYACGRVLSKMSRIGNKRKIDRIIHKLDRCRK